MSDTLDASDTFAGAMALLQNLVPDPSTKQLWQCRPASQSITTFSGFQAAYTKGFISCLAVFGNLAYGMIALSGGGGGTNFNGLDVPFCYNLASNAFVSITGTTDTAGNALNMPTSPVATGAWTPPSIALVGSKMIFTHPGFIAANGKYIGIMDVSNPSVPSWTAGNLTGAIAFTVVPSWVSQFNGRAYYIHNVVAQPAVIFSDSLIATNCTNASQVLTFGDNVALTAMGPLQLNNQLGGIIQSLMVFKSVQNIFQITGDAALNNLSVNTLNVVTGTFAPNAIQPTPKGLAFLAPDGFRMIDFQATISDPIGYDGQGTTVPFINAVVPSRMASACNGSILRASVQNGAKAGTPNEEYWYDFTRNIFFGPHTFPASLIAEWNNTFVMTPVGVLASLWRSDPVQSSSSTFVENGTQLQWTWQTPFLPDGDDNMSNIAVTETVVTVAFGVGVSTINVSALNQKSNVLAQATLVQQTQVTTWGSFTWGQSVWGGIVNPLTVYQIPWPNEIVANRLALQLQGQSAQGVKIGTSKLRYQRLRYIATPLAAA